MLLFDDDFVVSTKGSLDMQLHNLQIACGLEQEEVVQDKILLETSQHTKPQDTTVITPLKDFINIYIEDCPNAKVIASELFKLYRKSKFFQRQDYTKFVSDVVTQGYSLGKKDRKKAFIGMKINKQVEKFEYRKKQLASREDGINGFIKLGFEICDDTNKIKLLDFYNVYKESTFYKGEDIHKILKIMNYMGFLKGKQTGVSIDKLNLIGLRRINVLYDKWPCLHSVAK
jgi:hypothetical protein